MNFESFKIYATTYLWREFDTELDASFGSLMLQTMDELDKSTNDWQRRNGVAVILPTSGDYLISGAVSDFKNVKAVIDNTVSNSTSRMTMTSLEEVYMQRANPTRGNYNSLFAVDTDNDDKYLRFVYQFSDTDGGDLSVVYKRALPTYASDSDTSWLATDHLNLLLYTFMKHACLFLREDERLQAYTSLQGDALAIADKADKHQEAHAVSSAGKPPVHAVP